MSDPKTPKPGTKEYPIDKPQDLNTPEFNSGGRKEGDVEPPVENLNDQLPNHDEKPEHELPDPKTDLGNERDDDEENDERIIRR